MRIVANICFSLWGSAALSKKGIALIPLDNFEPLVQKSYLSQELLGRQLAALVVHGTQLSLEVIGLAES